MYKRNARTASNHTYFISLFTLTHTSSQHTGLKAYFLAKSLTGEGREDEKLLDQAIRSLDTLINCYLYNFISTPLGHMDHNRVVNYKPSFPLCYRIYQQDVLISLSLFFLKASFTNLKGVIDTAGK